MCAVDEDDKIRNKVYWGELPSSPPTVDPEQGAIEASMDTEPDRGTVLYPRPRLDLSAFKRRLHEALGWWGNLGGSITGMTLWVESGPP